MRKSMDKIFYILKYCYRRLIETKELNVYRKFTVNNELNNNKDNIFIITMPEYGNIGDHAIALSMLKYAKNKFPNHNIYEINDSNFYSSVKWIINNNKKTDYIFLIGGGNFGILYSYIEYWRRLVINKCRNAKIILFPQSSVWGDDLYNKLQLKRSSRIYSKNKNLYLMARDRATYELMKLNFENKSYLVPDIVLIGMLQYLIDKNHQRDIDVLLCMRTDIEKTTSDSLISNAKKTIDSMNMVIKEFDTETYSTILRKDSEGKIRDAINMFNSSKYVITDRLHGMIFSQITGTPCLALDNVTRKVSGVYNLWIDHSNVYIFDDTKDIDTQIKKLLTLKRIGYNTVNNYKTFDEVIDLIIKED